MDPQQFDQLIEVLGNLTQSMQTSLWQQAGLVVLGAVLTLAVQWITQWREDRKETRRKQHERAAIRKSLQAELRVCQNLVDINRMAESVDVFTHTPLPLNLTQEVLFSGDPLLNLNEPAQQSLRDVYVRVTMLNEAINDAHNGTKETKETALNAIQEATKDTPNGKSGELKQLLEQTIQTIGKSR